MTIGVIVTVYNLEKFVEQAIDSVLRQSVKPSKLVIVNDASKDRSLEIISRYSDSAFIINNEHNQGVLPSIISAIKLLNTDLIAFLDGDDVWKTNKLEEVIKSFSQDNDAMLVTHSYEWINASGEVLHTIDETHQESQRIVRDGKSIQARDLLVKNSILSYKGVWLGSAFCIRRGHLDIEEFENWSTNL